MSNSSTSASFAMLFFRAGVPLLIVNPRSGHPRPDFVRWALVDAALGSRWPGQVVFCSESVPLGAVARAGLAGGCSGLAVWGGDGSVAAVAEVLAGSGVPLGIVPGGSGNGTASALGIPASPVPALRNAFGGPVAAVDVGSFAGRPFLAVAGVGLDAAVARAFEAGPLRGLPGYALALARTFRRSAPVSLRVLEGSDSSAPCLWHGPAAFASACNAPGWGCGLRLAPSARPGDGSLRLVLARPFSLRSVPAALAAGWGVGPDPSSLPFLRTFTGDRFVLADPAGSSCPVPAHADGEPFEAVLPVEVSVRFRALLVRTPGIPPAR